MCSQYKRARRMMEPEGLLNNAARSGLYTMEQSPTQGASAAPHPELHRADNFCMYNEEAIASSD
jgi:hypothetical protein